MRYKVPQNVQREDRIFWIITLRQLIMLILGIGISYLLFISFSKSYQLGVLGYMLIALPGLFSVGFAFLRVSGMSLFQMILVVVEAIYRPPKRLWEQGSGSSFVSLTTKTSLTEKKDTSSPQEASSVSLGENKTIFSDIAQILDR